MNLLAPKRFDEFSAIEYYQYIDSLYTPGTSKQSKLVDGISISKNKKGSLIIRANYDAYQRDQITTLAVEYKIDELELLIAILTRDIGIMYLPGDARKEFDYATYEQAKKDARSKSRKRKNSSKD